MATKARLMGICLAAALTLCASLAGASSALGSFHQVKIREISGSSGNGHNSYIELQMYAPGQNLVSGQKITLWDPTAVTNDTPFELTLTGPNPPNSQNQRTILIGDTDVDGRDFTLNLDPYLDSASGANLVDAGAVCFHAIPVDCVSWDGPGFPDLSTTDTLPDRATPFPGPLPVASALRRQIVRGCPTLLEPIDDSDDSAADFDVVDRDPTPNSATPIEFPCAPSRPPVRCGGLVATKVGTAGRDVIRGTPKRDVIAGLGGNDVIRGLGGNDVLCGGAGNDKLFGGRGRDLLLGGPGRDILRGGPGRDRLRGGPGRDKLIQ